MAGHTELEEASLSELEDYHCQLWITIIANLVPTTLICYDYFLTLARETRHVWWRGLSNAVVLFCVVRYSALVGVLASILALAPWRGMSNKLTLAEMAISSSVDPHLHVCNYSNQMADVASARCARRPDSTHTNPLLTLSHAIAVVSRGVIIARSSSIIADVLVIVVTWVRAWPMVREAASLSSSAKLATILVVDGTTYFAWVNFHASPVNGGLRGATSLTKYSNPAAVVRICSSRVLLAVNIIELCFIREINLLESSSNWLSALTAITTVRFILDLHEAENTLCGVDGSALPGGVYEDWVAPHNRWNVGSFNDRLISNLKSIRVIDATSGIYGIVVASHDKEDYSNEWGHSESPDDDHVSL
ncbi:hypothetical protein C8Q79DRAFT_1118915 [Trametes meyenii]|nr:hypothetical protein C8Q79DRAFT_1118915 [Trametes meyenii]